MKTVPSKNNSPHLPVLLQEVVQWSGVKPGDTIVDGTVGFGGHAQALLPYIMPGGTYLGIDKDQRALDYSGQALQEFAGTVVLRRGQFSLMNRIAREAGLQSANMVLLDLGVSSPQLDDPQYGLSFTATGALDMQVGEGTTTAYDIINQWSEQRLKQLFTEHGQPATNRLVRAIIETRDKRPIDTIEQLVEVIVRQVPRKPGIHPATRVFQALRIAVNREYEELDRGLEQAVELLEKGGRLLVISFHSGEDKRVKEFLTRESKTCICPPDYPVCVCNHVARMKVLTKPIATTFAEIQANPRSRSARLRVAEKFIDC